MLNKISAITKSNNESSLYELSEIADKRFSHGEDIPQNIIDNVKRIVSNGGFIGMAQINPIAGNIEYNAKKIAKYIKYSCICR